MINRHWLIFGAGNAGVYQGLYHNRHTPHTARKVTRARAPWASLARPRACALCDLEPSGIWLLGDFRRGQPLFGSWFVGLGWLPVAPLFCPSFLGGFPIFLWRLGFISFYGCVFGSCLIRRSWVDSGDSPFLLFFVDFLFFGGCPVSHFFGFGGFPISI